MKLTKITNTHADILDLEFKLQFNVVDLTEPETPTPLFDNVDMRIDEYAECFSPVSEQPLNIVRRRN